MEIDILILSEVKSERERQIPYNITYTWDLKYDTNDLSTKQKQIIDMDGRQSCVYQGIWGRVGWIGSLGLVDANYCIWSR